MRTPFLRKEKKNAEQSICHWCGQTATNALPYRKERAILLKKGRAVVWRMVPFTIMLLDRTIDNCSPNQPIVLKVDPGAETTGLAILMTRGGQPLRYLGRKSQASWVVYQKPIR